MSLVPATEDDRQETLHDDKSSIPIEFTKSPPKYEESANGVQVEQASELAQEPVPEEDSEPTKRPDPLFFTTLDRALDSLRNPAKFISQPPIDYAEKLSKVEHQRLVTISSSLRYVTLDSTQLLPGGFNLTQYHGLVVPKDVVQCPEKVYHFVIKVKSKIDKPQRMKHMFYAYPDSDLKPEDKSSLILDKDDIIQKVSNPSNDEELYISDVVKSSLPQTVNSINLVSEKTFTIVRLEILEPVLTAKELSAFEETEIQTRVSTYLSKLEAENQNPDLSQIKIPNSLECLNTLFRVLKGPLENYNSTQKKTLKPNVMPFLQTHLDLNTLKDKFFFRETDVFELEPPLLQDFGDFKQIIADYFSRALQETLYVGSIYAPDPNLFFKTQVTVDSTLREVFQAFDEPDLDKQLHNWEKWSDFGYSPGFTALSVGVWYPDSLIQEAYNRTVGLDELHKPVYFDALKFCAMARDSQELQIYVSSLESQGMIGFDELKQATKRLGIVINSIDDIAQYTDDQLIQAYKNNIVLSTSRQQKNQLRSALTTLGKYRNSKEMRLFLNTEPLFDLSDAFDALETNVMVDDDVLITAYQLKSEDTSYYDATLPRALYTIALHRKSMLLMSYINDNLSQFAGNVITLAEAYNIVGADQYADDASVIRIFQERVQKESYTHFHETWRALNIIGNTRQSKLIEGFLSSGVIDSTLLATDKTPAGLNNIGNTCYLNSLLQYYFVIAPLRDQVLNFDEVLTDSVFEANPNYAVRRIGGRVVGYKETERSYQFMYQLRGLYHDMIHENSRCVTPTKELAYLAFSPISDEVQFEVKEEKIPAPDTELTTTTDTEGDTEMDLETKLSESSEPAEPDAPAVDQEPKIETDADDVSMADSEVAVPSLEISHDQMENALEIGRQQDVTECISNVLSQIESALDPDHLDTDNEQLDFVKSMFYGKTKQTLVPLDPESSGKPRTKIERFLNLIVNIGDHPRDIYDALDTFFTEDILELDNEEVKRSLTITELPNILQIQVQRVQFDRQRLIPVKSTEPLPFEEKLYMDRYMDTENPDVIKKREEVFQWRRQIEALNEKRAILTQKSASGMSVKEALQYTREYLQTSPISDAGIIVDQNTLDVLEQEINRIDEQLKEIDTETARLQETILNQFSGFNKIGYTIFAIFIHRGQASYGHYWIYIRDPKTGLYRKYNDEIVSEVPPEEVLNFNESNTATPYYLTFIKDELVDKIEPLRREVEEV